MEQSCQASLVVVLCSKVGNESLLGHLDGELMRVRGMVDQSGLGEDSNADLITEVLLKESDRGIAVFGAELLAEDLEKLLKAYFRSEPDIVAKVVDPLFRLYAPLSTFSARIQIAYALCLVPTKLKNVLELIRRIRNDFAHYSGSIDFSDPKVADRLRLLIAEGRPAEEFEKDQPRLFGHQLLSKRQIIDRTAFAIAIAEASAKIRFYWSWIESGRDVRRAVLARDRAGSKEA